jgi:hypothetical protein
MVATINKLSAFTMLVIFETGLAADYKPVDAVSLSKKTTFPPEINCRLR